MKQQINLGSFSKIILVGGWTGWHIQPIVSLTKQLKIEHDISDFVWIGGRDSQEQKIAQKEHISFFPIPTLKLATTRSFRVLLYPIYIILGLLWARSILKKIMSTDKKLVIFSKWWPGSVAIGMAAWSLSVPIYIHESDTIPGISNRILGKIASKIFLWFENAKQYFDSKKCEVVGQILDPIFSQTESNAPQYPVSWKTAKPHILVICGSQWSRAIFASIIDQFSNNTDYEWIIALGKLNSNMANEFSNISDCQGLDWISQENIAWLIQHTNIAITRWSATTLAELTVFTNSPHLIIVPLPYSAWDHQLFNAREYEKTGHTILQQQDLWNLTKTIYNLITYEWHWSKNE